MRSAFRRELGALRRRVRAWPLVNPGFGCLEPGLRRAYRDGKRSEAEAYAARTDEAFHEWRKRAKDLRYHVQLLGPAWSKPLEDLEKELHDLTDRLGDDHDLADLRQTLRRPRRQTGHVGRVIDRIGHRRSELQADASPLGARIYAEKPRRFSKRIESYWDVWRA
jgi:CHAD domain-containing protein